MNRVVEIAPSARLSPWVECFWTREAFASPDEVVHRVLPDGCADLLIDLSDGGTTAVGTMTRPVLFAARSGPAYFGICFRSGRARQILGLPLPEITDARVPLAALSTLGIRLADDVQSRLSQERDRRLDGAVTLLSSGASVDDAAHATGMTRQRLRRVFLDAVGVGPKAFARVARFRRLLRRARSVGHVSWSALAADLGYADQSHLIAEFREFAGSSPVPFFLSPE